MNEDHWEEPAVDEGTPEPEKAYATAKTVPLSVDDLDDNFWPSN